MTAQISDDVIFEGEEYSLIGISGGKLVSLEQFGMKAGPSHTACYRGFYVTYEIKENTLYLRELTITGKMEEHKPIYGVESELGRYSDLNEMIPFTGKIRIAKDFMDELYVHMGHQKATAFKTVLDIMLEEGRVIEIKSRSEEMEHKSGAFKKSYTKGDFLSIMDAFSMDMDIE